MLRESFIGKRPSSFHLNGVVKSFIISETFLWSAWNFVTPIFAIFAATKIPGGNLEVAASAFSVHLAVRVIFELISGKYMSRASDNIKYVVIILGLSMLSLSYIGFALTRSVAPLYVFYAIIGAGLGIASPVKNSLFSTHLDKNKEPEEWGIHDAVVFMGMALSAALGGFIANQYGFTVLFYIAGIINLVATIPYFLFIQNKKN